ncbi:DUF4330 domain-containing protein [Pseudobacteroides cellulosolvens]|uniref:DUF4330 domain-containing protein n=1 Tax=Pseudobacteroides cellulosolvens ATCC 35603 = DSM 2933 TaxID=398512 RepID=A0A0L6JNJ8_9FIRM|nr:DUF4330 domain-containing protein [Pseudobacteroides cellulosolvens]KNY27396.1 Protein of unknown function DUF4330 [Pseudobacteroides cellulosolvens ATCC 35603 = DSM 2933]
MILDSKGKLFGKISIVDVLIVLVVLGAIAGVGYKLTKSDIGIGVAVAKKDNIEISFYADEVPEYAAKAVSKGDLAKDFERNVEFGKVTNVEIGNSVSWAANEKGEIVTSSKKGFSSIKVTIEGPGVYRDGKSSSGVNFGSADFYTGRNTILLVGNSTFQCRIYDIKKKG